MMRKFLICILSVLCIVAPKAVAQTACHDNLAAHERIDTLGRKPSKYPYLESVAKILSTNAVVWGFDRFIMKEDWAYIGGSTIKRNFKRGPIWDTNSFSTNLFSHPFHGSLYFTSARTSGLSFAESVPCVLFGSFMWEFFMENEYPSTNDLIATTFGGVALGEMSFRTTDLLVDSRLTGANRAVREVLIGILSPIRAIDRLISGEAWRVTPHSRGNALADAPFELAVSGGVRSLYDGGAGKHFKAGATLGVEMRYGELCRGESYVPYEWFDFGIRVNGASHSPFVSAWRSTALLWGKTFGGKHEHSMVTLGAYQHFRYYDLNSSRQHFRLGEASSLGGGCMYELQWKKDFSFDGALFLNAVPLGAVSSDFLIMDDRDYNWGSGYGVKAGMGLQLGKEFSMCLASEMMHLFSWNGYPEHIDWSTVDTLNYNIQGDKSRAVGVVSSFEAEYRFTPHWGLSFTYNNYYRHTDYEYQGVRTHTFHDFILSAAYHF